MRIALALVALLILWGCGDQDDGPQAPGVTSMNVVAYNVGMARGYVDHAAERFEPILSAINAVENADVICLQEMWGDDDISALLAATADTYPETYMHRTRLSDFSDEDEMGPACTQEEIVDLVECAVPLCDGDEDLAGCVLGSCGDEFSSLSAGCQECAAGNIALNNVPDIIAACTSEDADRYTYDGHNGLLLLSKTPLSATEFRVMPSFLTVRGILYAEVHGVSIACTHLTATLSNPEYNGNYASYGEENDAQMVELIDFMNEKSAGNPAIIMGDFNAGPADGDTIAPALADNYARLTSDGWKDPNVETGAPVCTWCSDNPIAGENTRDRILDHIVVKHAAADGFERLFDGRIEIEKDGEVLNVCLSDHYGVRANVNWD